MILLARPAPHLARTHTALHAAGFAQGSLLSFSLAEPQTIPLMLPSTVTDLILTSPLAVPALQQAFAAQPNLQNLPVYCVGSATARAAAAAGAQVTFTGTDNGHTMAQGMCAMLAQPRHFAHLHGDHAGMEWHSILHSRGHQVTPVAAYRTGHVDALPPHIQQQLTQQAFPNYTLLFSAGSARHLANLLKQANIQPRGTALCLSPAVAQVAAIYWPQVHTANQTTLEGLIHLLQQPTDTSS